MHTDTPASWDDNQDRFRDCEYCGAGHVESDCPDNPAKEPKTDELGVSFIVTEWISELPLEVSALHEVTHENWQELYAQLRLYVDRCIAAELRVWDEAIKQGATHRSSLTQRIAELTTDPKELHNES